VEHVVIDGVDVAFEADGSGPPLVLLHGILQDSRAWRAQFADLRDEFTVVAWDAPGCGRSADPPETWRSADYAHCLSALISGLGLAAPIVAGLSWGATLAIEHEHRHPGVAAALVLAGAYAGWAGSLAPHVCDERLRSCLAQSGMPPRDVVPEWIPDLLTSAAPAELVREVTTMMSDFHPAGFRAIAHGLAEADLRAVLPTIGVPVLLLYGDDDRRAPAETVGAALADRIPDARLVVLPGAGHLCNAEQPAAFDRAVRAFAARGAG
jgi:pimeloyl-ACP methyl ester carboxylesterase